MFGRTNPTLPLKDAGNIVQGNACRIDWETVCPNKEGGEVYLFGNPPYIGFQERENEQKEDMDIIFKNVSNVKRLDYIGCWFKNATDFIKGRASYQYAFVTTNSICQGEQVSLLWPYIFNQDQEIFFAFHTFKWTNNAKGNAGVSCNIIGIRNTSNNSKYIFTDGRKHQVDTINAYLIEGSNIIMHQRTNSISGFPEMVLGSSGIDGGHLLLTHEERESFINTNPASSEFIRPFVGGGDLLKGTERYCLWIEDDKIDEAKSIEQISNRIEKCRAYRLGAGRDAKKAANVPHRFFYRKYQDGEAIVLPMTSSENRKYIPASFLKSGTIPSNGVFVIYNSTPEIFSVLSSRLHQVWLVTLSGKLESRIRYSVNLNYNTFPFPPISKQQKWEITQCMLRILEEREKHSEKTLAQLYDIDKMPESLREAHRLNDLAVERCYRSKPFKSDEERLEYLFKLYEKMIAEEQEN